MNYCVIWIAPKRGFAAIAVTNVDEDSHAPCDAVVSKFIASLLAGDEGKPQVENKGGAGRKASPFSAVRWEADEAVVMVGKQWFKLVSLDGIASGKIIAFCERTYEDKWQKRFEEDLVEVLIGMGHEPTNMVELVVKPLDSSLTKTLKGVAMTKENRDAIRAARAAARK